MIVPLWEWIPPADAEAMSLIRMVGDDPCLEIAALDPLHSPWSRDAGPIQQVPCRVSHCGMRRGKPGRAPRSLVVGMNCQRFATWGVPCLVRFRTRRGNGVRAVLQL